MKSLQAVVLVALFGLLTPLAAHAADVRLGLGADYQINRRGLLNLNLSVDGNVARYLQVGGRFGALVTTGPHFGAPLDLEVRALLANRRVYVEGLVGPWLMFDEAALIRLHAALGFGLQTSVLTFGFEVGYLDPAALIGLRLGFRI